MLDAPKAPDIEMAPPAGAPPFITNYWLIADCWRYGLEPLQPVQADPNPVRLTHPRDSNAGLRLRKAALDAD